MYLNVNYAKPMNFLSEMYRFLPETASVAVTVE